MLEESPKRLPPAARSAEILNAAKQLLGRGGVRNFSLEAVAREAGVAASLPRHYFGSSTELLVTAIVDLIKEVEHEFRTPSADMSLRDRLSAYLDIIEKAPWGHLIWIGSADIDPAIDELVKKSRLRLGEAIYQRHWNSMTHLQQIYVLGSVGFIEAVVSNWIEQDFKERQLVLDILVHWVTQVGTDKIIPESVG